MQDRNVRAEYKNFSAPHLNKITYNITNLVLNKQAYLSFLSTTKQ